MTAGRVLKTKTLAHKSVLKCAKSLPFLFEYCLSAAARCRHLLCCTAVKSPSGMWMPDRSKNREQRGGEKPENENLQTTFWMWTARNSAVKHIHWNIWTTENTQVVLIKKKNLILLLQPELPLPGLSKHKLQDEDHLACFRHLIKSSVMVSSIILLLANIVLNCFPLSLQLLPI